MKRKIIILTIIFAVAAFTLGGCLKNNTTTQNTHEPQTPEETQIPVETKLPEVTKNSNNIENIPPAMPETKNIKFNIEGMVEEEEFKLIYNKESKIFTYVPSDYLVETETFEGNEFIKAYTNEEKTAAVILYAIDGTGEEQMLEIEKITDAYFANLGYEYYGAISGDDICEGEQISYIINKNTDDYYDPSHVGSAELSSTTDKTFVLAYYSPLAYSEGIESRFYKIFEEIETY